MSSRRAAAAATVLVSLFILSPRARAERVGDLPKEATAASGTKPLSTTVAPPAVNPPIEPTIPLTAQPTSQTTNQPAVDPLNDVDPTSDFEPLDASGAVAVQECAVRFAEELNVPSTEAGLIAELHVSVGQTIALGDELARLEDRSWKIRSRAATLRLAAAQQQVADDLELRYAEAARSEALAELETNRSIYNESSGAVPLSNLRRLKLAVERAELEVARAKKNTKQAEIEVDLRAADVAVIEDTLRRLRLLSPLTGVVLQTFKQRGEWVASGETVLRLARLDRLQVDALLSGDQLAPHECLDQRVSVSWIDPVNRQPHHLRGRVVAVQPHRLAGGRYRIQAEVVNQRTPGGRDWMLHPGTEVEMSVYPLHRPATRNASGSRPSSNR